jgi:hypothetical protein
MHISRLTGASHLTVLQHEPKDLMAVVQMMGDASLTTANRHYFNIDDNVLAEVIDG